MECGLVGDGELVRSHGQAAPLLEPVDAPFDGVALLVRLDIERWWGSPDSMPGRAMRATSPRSRSQARCSAEKYALSARSLTGRRRRGPRRDRTAGMPRMSGLRARLSCMFAPDTATASGMPWASDSTCSLLPFLPRSTGFDPVSDPPFFWRERRPRRRSPRSSPPRPGPRVRPALRCSRRHRPASVRTVKRRCAVAGDVPNVAADAARHSRWSARTPLP